MNIQWPKGLSQTDFVRNYWQKKPLLIRQAFPNFENPLPADELAGLACDEDIPARLISHTAPDKWHCEHGPFSEDRLSTLPPSNWSLLVSDIEKHLPDFVRYLEPFRFISDWRIDDLMISLAPPGGSVGPHIDRYDVFLLQAEGKRRWLTSDIPLSSAEFLNNEDIKILRRFCADNDEVLEPGDMLYLPPGIGHHGVAVDLCMTWSIGFRAPRLHQLLLACCEAAIDTIDAEELFVDELLSAQSTPGKIDTHTLQNASKKMRALFDAVIERPEKWFGRVVSDNGHPSIALQTEIDAYNLVQHLLAGGQLERRTDAQLAFIDEGDTSRLFVNGDEKMCTTRLAKLLCEKYRYSKAQLEHFLNVTDQADLLLELVNSGVLEFSHH